MSRRAAVITLLLVATLSAVGWFAFAERTAPDGPSPCGDVPRPSVERDAASLNRVDVWLAVPNGTVIARVEALIAATPEARQIGLRDVDSLDEGEGMLFVHGSEATWGYSTAQVSFPLDIVFAGTDGTITTIHHVPAAGAPAGVSGRGQYILQVPRGYTNETGVDVGDCLSIPLELRNAA